MKTATAILLTALLIMAIEGCSYSDPEIYYFDPIQGDSATVVLITNLDTLDEVVLTDSLMICYTAQIEGGKLYFIEASLESLLLYEYTSSYDPDTLTGPYVLKDSFWIPDNLPIPPGMISLLFSLYYSSNTNSLADLFEIEAHSSEFEFSINLGGVSE